MLGWALLFLIVALVGLAVLLGYSDARDSVTWIYPPAILAGAALSVVLLEVANLYQPSAMRRPVAHLPRAGLVLVEVAAHHHGTPVLGGRLGQQPPHVLDPLLRAQGQVDGGDRDRRSVGVPHLGDGWTPSTSILTWILALWGDDRTENPELQEPFLKDARGGVVSVALAGDESSERTRSHEYAGGVGVFALEDDGFGGSYTFSTDAPDAAWMIARLQ